MEIWDDVQGPPPSPEVQAIMKVWFREMVAAGRIKVLTYKVGDDSFTFITKGEPPLTESER